MCFGYRARLHSRQFFFRPPLSEFSVSAPEISPPLEASDQEIIGIIGGSIHAC